MDSPQAPWWWRRSLVRDAIYAALLTVCIVFGAYGEAHPRQVSDQIPATSPAAHTPTAALLLVAVAGLVLAVRNRWPRLVLAVSAGAVAVYSLLGYVNGAAVLAPVVAVYTLATKETARRAIAWSAAVLVVLMAATAAHNPFGPTGAGFYLIPGLIAVACLGGIAVASRRAYVASIEAHADHEAQRRIDEERLRIARDLHDVVAHTMATINVQAGTAAHVAAERPEVATQALLTIKAASKDGLRELRAILNVLRPRRRGGSHPAHARHRPDRGTGRAGPAGRPGDHVQRGRPAAAAVRRRRAGGLPDRAGVADQYGPARRAGDGRGVAHLPERGTAGRDHRYRPGARRGRFRTGAGGPHDGDAADRPPGSGHGLAGMRERATSVGGTIEAGPLAASGFRVAARLPAPAVSGPAAPVGSAAVADEASAVHGAENADGAKAVDGAKAADEGEGADVAKAADGAKAVDEAKDADAAKAVDEAAVPM